VPTFRPHPASHETGAPASVTSTERAATTEEAAAIAAAIERFLHDTAPVSSAGEGAREGWTRTALLEGVMRHERPAAPHPWINT
jgi:hypothetical protein